MSPVCHVRIGLIFFVNNKHRRSKLRTTFMQSVMHMEWADLCFAHWRWDPAEVAARLPAGLALDAFDGAAWLGVVPFRMNAVKPLGCPCPLARGIFSNSTCAPMCDRKGRPGFGF